MPCGLCFEVMMDILSPTSTFIKVDFPTLGLPTIFTNPALCIIFELKHKGMEFIDNLRFEYVSFTICCQNISYICTRNISVHA